MPNPTQLNHAFALAGALRFTAGNGGLTCARIATSAATACVYLHGAQITEWQPRGQAPVLWMSAHSNYDAGKAIRGGVPICFPWFGPHSTQKAAPAHGFARLSNWQVVDTRLLDDGRIEISFQLSGRTISSPLWPADFTALYTLTIGVSLEMALQIENRSLRTISFEEALHTYLAVSDVRRVRIHGLEQTDYFDKIDGRSHRADDKNPLMITGETDRIHADSGPEIRLEDPDLARCIIVAKQHSANTVVWNPWIAKSRQMSDFGDDEWIQMLCIESCNITHDSALTLAPGARHTLRTTLTVIPLT